MDISRAGRFSQWSRIRWVSWTLKVFVLYILGMYWYANCKISYGSINKTITGLKIWLSQDREHSQQSRCHPPWQLRWISSTGTHATPQLARPIDSILIHSAVKIFSNSLRGDLHVHYHGVVAMIDMIGNSFFTACNTKTTWSTARYTISKVVDPKKAKLRGKVHNIPS